MNNNTYVVQQGDTLYGISRQFNTSAQKIRELNNLTSDIIVPNQVLIISSNSDSNPSECVVYTVKKGDSLYSIAQKYDSTADAIKRYNNLSSNTLAIGQKLKIPCYMDDNSDNYVNYTVKKGDSLYSIAKKFGTTFDEIKSDNNLKTNNLAIGDVLKVKDNTSVSVIEECYGEDFTVPLDYINYVVQKGDNLYSIAKKYNTTVNDILQLNNLTSNALSIGQSIRIPTTVKKYIVKKGDNLYSIAREYNTTVSEIKRKNNLSSNALKIGQDLLV